MGGIRPTWRASAGLKPENRSGRGRGREAIEIVGQQLIEQIGIEAGRLGTGQALRTEERLSNRRLPLRSRGLGHEPRRRVRCDAGTVGCGSTHGGLGLLVSEAARVGATASASQVDGTPR